MRTAGWLFLLMGLFGALAPVAAQNSAPSQPGLSAPSAPAEAEEAMSVEEVGTLRDASLFYIAEEKVFLYNQSDSTAPAARLSVRTPVTRLSCKDEWCRVRTEEEGIGFVPAAALSNVWIRVSKEDRRVYLYEGPELVRAYEADMGYNSFADKERRGSAERRDHWRTPEGVFYVVRKNPQSQFYKALVLNYPTVEDARRGLDQGLITQPEYEAIEEAQEAFRMPPMDTDLGGWIEIHGEGTGDATTWTQGCVAVHNGHMNELWARVRVGTPVRIE